MPSSPLAEAPHYNGKTLSPTSPKPIHIPEPQNIPVLQNQIDPVFNLISTHMEDPKGPEASPMTIHPGDYQSLAQPQATSTHGENVVDYLSTLNGRDSNHEYQDGQDGRATFRQENQDAASSHSANDQQSISMGISDYVSAPAQSNVVSFTQNQNLDHHAEAPLSATSDYQSTSIAHVNLLPNAATSDAQDTSEATLKSPYKDFNTDGGNIQALLDNLIASASAAPSAENNAEAAAGAASSNVPPPLSPSSAQTPIAALPTPAGLPPRPPPQDEPAIHPNYTPGQSIRSYHNPPIQPVSGASPNTQSNNSYRPPNYPPSNGVSPSGMAPPSSASFQQSPSVQGQRSPQEQQLGEFGRNVGRSDLSTQRESSQSQLGPDRDRAYQDFLRDEATYVSEGTWDRFPQGSRLFIGMLMVEVLGTQC